MPRQKRRGKKRILYFSHLTHSIDSSPSPFKPALLMLIAPWTTPAWGPLWAVTPRNALSHSLSAQVSSYWTAQLPITLIRHPSQISGCRANVVPSVLQMPMHPLLPSLPALQTHTELCLHHVVLGKPGVMAKTGFLGRLGKPLGVCHFLH